MRAFFFAERFLPASLEVTFLWGDLAELLSAAFFLPPKMFSQLSANFLVAPTRLTLRGKSYSENF